MRSLNIKSKMRKKLPGSIYSMLKLIGTLAEGHNSRAYIVGGFVRDLFLGVKNLDIDITVEPDGIKFAFLLAKKLNGKAVPYKRFGTASVFLRWPKKANVIRIDITTARKERYRRPGALPEVKSSSIKDDLLRRDFTINAMAASLNPGDFGEVCDFFGGCRDITDGVIRVLHKGSFIDDPTRIFRAVRFEQRFGFKIDKRTKELIRNAVNLKMFSNVSKERIKNELLLILKEKNPLKALLRMDELHEFRFIHPRIKLTKRVLYTLKSIKNSEGYFNTISKSNRTIDIKLIYLMALLKELSKTETLKLLRDYGFRKSETSRILSYKESSNIVYNVLRKAGALAPSRVYSLLKGFPPEGILLMHAEAKDKRTKKRINDYLVKYSRIKLKIKGDDLKCSGIRPGPIFKDILKHTLYAKIDGKLKTKNEEFKFALSLAGKKR